MHEAAIAPIRAVPLAELPAVALRVAAGFADQKVQGLDSVQIAPGPEDGRVLVTGFSQTRAVQVTAEGSCQRRLALPVGALCAALSRDKSAEHLTVVDGGDVGLLSVRTFGPDCTVAVSMPEAGNAHSFRFPEVTPGPCEVEFSGVLLRAVLRDLQPLTVLRLEPFGGGLQVTGACDGVSVFALLAGINPDK